MVYCLCNRTLDKKRRNSLTKEINKEELLVQQEYIEKVKAINAKREQMPLAHVHSFGCQQNVSDGEKIKGMLAQMGYGFTPETAFADLILFNTCAVRENAEDRVFGNIGALKKLKEKNRNLIIAVGGCMVTHVMHTLPQMIYEKLSENRRTLSIPESDGVIAEGLPVIRESKVKASVPIMYGCNNFCTYCIVPFVRGRERSRRPEEVIAEVKGLINDGYKEILLLGQNVNSYGKEYDFGFAKLLSELDKIPGKYKLSFMTSHPKDCTHELIDTIADSRHISYHLHLPVQCGSDRILKEMNRHYDTAHYLELIEYAKKRIPKVALTTDIIVGFPGETYEDFLGTVELMKKVRYDSAYTFIYSKREGTKAAAMPDPISDEDKGKWFRQLLDVQNSIGEKAYERFIGDEVEVLCEGIGRTADGLMTGHSRHGVIVDFNGTRDMIGKYVTVRIQKALPWAVTGELVSVND
ncbi:MAG: MiaB/RimO family radical SAM methylthiotransferase [[Eubacterium] siraeum]|nr:MiaB/RimO family radical SAM methylthiotransferase [[Eubacterium] siraeum]